MSLPTILDLSGSDKVLIEKAYSYITEEYIKGNYIISIKQIEEHLKDDSMKGDINKVVDKLLELRTVKKIGNYVYTKLCDDTKDLNNFRLRTKYLLLKNSINLFQ